MARLTDTIAAIATPPGRGGIAVIRISGPQAFAIADAVFHGRQGRLSALPTRSLCTGALRDPVTGETVDHGIALLFRAPRSYTGENVVELQCHGGAVAPARVLAAVLAAGARHAEPGEFTRRAFIAGRIDLAQAEAVCDLVNARTDEARRLALRQHDGALSRRVAAARATLLDLLAGIEASLDFGDEVDAPDPGALSRGIAAARARVTALARSAARGRLYRDGVRLAVAGRTNVGKSSLVNALLRDHRSIVTDVPGTTRDIVEAELDLGGIPVTLLDTAGLRPTSDPVEAEGVRRAQSAAAGAGLVLFVVDASEGWTDADSAALRVVQEAGRDPAVWALNKWDLPPPAGGRAPAPAGSAPAVPVSALTGLGLDDLEAALRRAVAGAPSAPGEGGPAAGARHAADLGAALSALAAASEAVEQALPPDLAAAELRAAADALGRITGETATADLVDRIFSGFCIGK